MLDIPEYAPNGIICLESLFQAQHQVCDHDDRDVGNLGIKIIGLAFAEPQVLLGLLEKLM